MNQNQNQSQGTDYSSSASSYYYAPPPAPATPNPNPYSASAPPFSAYSAPPDYPTYTQYPPIPQSQYNYPSYAPPPGMPNSPYYTNLTDNPPSPYPSYHQPAATAYPSSNNTYPDNSYQDFYGKKADDAFNEGVYAYDGGPSEPYGARGTAPTRSPMLFDDYGRSISFSGGSGGTGTGAGGANGTATKIVKAVPKADANHDVKSGVQKFRVKILPEGAGSPMDVLCQIGLDGIRMLDPGTSRMLRVYPLETVTRWEVLDSSIFAFWSKSSVDYEPRRIRLQSNSYTTSTLLDTVTAATVQFKEIGGSSFTKEKADTSKTSEQQPGKKGFDWMNLIKIPNEEKDHWVPDEAVKKCNSCGGDFNAFNRRHHCRNCGDIFCDKCSQGRIALTAEDNAQPVRVCDQCLAEVTHRLSTTKESGNKSTQSHEDLARKLQEELERNRKSSSGSKSNGSGGRLREVACPVCTVHLQVQVPKSGSETIECGVCQHPFLVSAD